MSDIDTIYYHEAMLMHHQLATCERLGLRVQWLFPATVKYREP